ncbi:MAG: hypothetical protein QGH11_09255, partial [Pirellulaceae bacterium]|nr:hypothetical protein [Pirellulaceae bacterium]
MKRKNGANHSLPAARHEHARRHDGEAKEKLKNFKHRDKMVLHFIGRLQSNKARKAGQIFDVIQTVDSIKLAKR